MNKDEIKEFNNWFYTGTFNQDYYIKFINIRNKYQIKDKDEQISLKKAMQFIRDVFEVDFVFYDKFIRYARKYNLLIEEEKAQKNWKLKITYGNIFKLMLIPLYEILKEKEK